MRKEMTLKNKGTADFTTQKSMIAARNRYFVFKPRPPSKHQTSKGATCGYLPKRAGM